MAPSMHPRLLGLPTEIFSIVLGHITDPEDYFRLAFTCRDMFNTLNPNRECVVLDARRLRWWIEQFRPEGRARRQLLGMGNVSFLSYWLKHYHEQEPNPFVQRTLEVYQEVFPEALHGTIPDSPVEGLDPLAVAAIDAENLGAFVILLERRLAPSLKDMGPLYKIMAVGSPVIANWLLAKGIKCPADNPSL
ncbi:hypothetical protein F4677DRAFT_462031 [Hypoxylon crocopeplum]|nr:hypothetical protein F4677DRAFT_462031 [Hypoxylon crocopeplum]